MPIGRNRGTTPNELLLEINKIRSRGKAGQTAAQKSQFEIESVMDFLFQTTVKGDRLLAQDARQTEHNIRGGGAANTSADAVNLMKEAVTSAEKSYLEVLASDRKTFRHRMNKLEKAYVDVLESEAKNPVRLMLQFVDGFRCLYADSSAKDWLAVACNPSVGRGVWARGWGPDRHPSYLQMSVPDPHRVLKEKPISSTWVAYAWLVFA